MKRKIVLLLWFAALPVFSQNGGVMPLTLRDGGAAAAAKLGGKPVDQMPAQAAGIDQATLVGRYGTILARVPVGAGGLTAWTVEKNGHRVVLYTTSDSQAIISGVVWDSMTGRNLSDTFNAATLSIAPPVGGVAAPAMSPVPVVAPASVAPTLPALVGKYSGPIPESIKAIDSLTGIKEGSGGQADTMYVIFDPRCPYCRKAYATTRDYVKRGFTIKWIPTLALGNPEQGRPMAATVLQAKAGDQADVLRRVLGNHEEMHTVPTKATDEALDRSLSFFFAAFKTNGLDQAGVPVAFFLDKHTGKPRMMTGVSEAPVIQAIFGKL